MREPPAGVTDAAVLATLGDAWNPDLTGVEHVPLGFGAHHWAAYDVDGPRLFVTLDRLEPKRSAAALEAAYAGAVALRAADLDFVLAPVPSIPGPLTVPFAGGRLGCTPWYDGEPALPFDLPWTTRALARLHATTPPPGITEWRPLVGPGFAEETATLTQGGWGPGPFAGPARDDVRRHLADLESWTTRYHHLADVARGRGWVATHGEPHGDNQLRTADTHFLIDWESLKLAPAELDLRALVDAGATTDADPEMLELFDLEWRLDEIGQYAAWFAAPHTGTRDDEIAFGGLRHELSRPSYAQATTEG